MLDLAQDVMDRAMNLEVNDDVLVRFKSKQQAVGFRWACYNVRKNAKRLSRQTAQPGEPDYDTSPYDMLSFSVEEDKLNIGGWLVRISSLNNVEIVVEGT